MKKYLIVISLYFFFTIIFTYPLIFQSSGSGYGDLGDPLAITNVLSWNYLNTINGLSNPFDSHIFFPNSLNVIGDILLGTQIIFAPFYFLTDNPVFSTNMVIFFSFFLSAVCMFAYSFYLTRNFKISFIAGFIFGFSPFRLGNSQIQLMSIYWIPLFFLFLDKFLRKLKTKDIIIAALIYCIQVLSSWYVGYMFTIGIIIYILIFLIQNKSNFEFRSFFTKSIIGAVIVMTIVAPFALYYKKITSENSFKQPLGTSVQYSASVDDYFLARQKNLIFGNLRITRPVIQELPLEKKIFDTALKIIGDRANNLGVSKLPGNTVQEKLSFERFSSIINTPSNEKNLFLGFIPLILSVLGIRSFRKNETSTNKDPQSQRNITKLKETNSIFLWIALIFLVFSLGPFLIIFGHFTYIPLPYLLFYYIFPAFDIMRVAARFGLMVMFATSVLSIAGLKYLFDKYKSAAYAKFIAPAIIVLITLEALTIPINMVRINVKDEIPAVYTWLKDAKIEGGVAEVPSIKGDLTKYDEEYGDRRSDFIVREIEYWYYTTYHQKHIVNGYATFFPDSYYEITKSLNDISNPESVEILKNYNVNTIIVHRDLFDEEDMLIWSDENIDSAGLEIAAAFGSDIVLKWKY